MPDSNRTSATGSPDREFAVGDYLTATPFALPWESWHNAAKLADQKGMAAGAYSPDFVHVVEDLDTDFNYESSAPFQMVMLGTHLPLLIAAATELGFFGLDLLIPSANDPDDGVDAVRDAVDKMYDSMADCAHDTAIDEDAEPEVVARLLAVWQAKPWRTEADWNRYGRAAIEGMCRRSGGVHPKIAPYLDDIVDGESCRRVWEAALLAPAANKPEPKPKPKPKPYVARALPASLAPDPEK